MQTSTSQGVQATVALSGIQGVVPILEQSVKALSEAFQRHSEAERDIAAGLGDVNRLVPLTCVKF